MKINLTTAVLSLLFVIPSAYADNMTMSSLDLQDGDSVDIREYPADGDMMLLGFPCDEGTGQAEMNTAELLSESGIEIWMPDLLSAHFLPKLNSAMDEIPAQDVVALIDAALTRSNKRVYLISSGRASTVLMRGLAEWERQHDGDGKKLDGVILLYPRLAAGAPDLGKAPVYIDAVGQTRTPIAILEGGKTPNSWALTDLKEKLEAGGGVVTTALIPGVRGFFYSRAKQSLPEDVVTTQLAGIVRASVIKLDMLTGRLN